MQFILYKNGQDTGHLCITLNLVLSCFRASRGGGGGFPPFSEIFQSNEMFVLTLLLIGLAYSLWVSVSLSQPLVCNETLWSGRNAESHQEGRPITIS